MLVHQIRVFGKTVVVVDGGGGGGGRSIRHVYNIGNVRNPAVRAETMVLVAGVKPLLHTRQVKLMRAM